MVLLGSCFACYAGWFCQPREREILFRCFWRYENRRTFQDGNWCWAYPSGALASSWQTIGGTPHYFDSQTLAMFRGRHEIDGSTYIFGDYGLVNGWFKDGVDWYYCSNGIAVTGWQLVNGTWYYLDPASDGKMSVGYLDLGNAGYYLNSNGAMAIGWAQSEDGWYFASLNLARLFLAGIKRA